MLTADNAEHTFRRSYALAWLVLGYGLLCFLMLLGGYFAIDRFWPAGGGLVTNLLIALWAAAMAGGLGGTASMLHQMYQHLAVEQTFERRPLTGYLLQPPIGVLFGLLALLVIVIPGAFIVEFAQGFEALLNNLSLSSIIAPFIEFFGNLGSALESTLPTPAFIALAVLVAWVAGFHQQLGWRAAKQRLNLTAEPGEAAPTRPALGRLDENDPFYYKRWLHDYRRLTTWTYSWGVLIIVYGLVWFIGAIAAFIYGWQALATWAETANPAVTLMLSAIPVGAAGSIGGVVRALLDLQEHASEKQDFHLQHLMSYLTLPIVGFALGMVMSFLVAAGYLVLNTTVTEQANLLRIIDAPAVVMIQLVLGWIAGFRQQPLVEALHRLLSRALLLLKLILAFLNPTTLFDADKRAERLAALKAQADLFERYTSGARTTRSPSDRERPARR
ncbi:MAG TPA: hypothetical protein PKE64_21225 [Anaerolineae bacterium]|nr:hypothetical protein [Anaerolineae bacterium]